MPHSQEEYFEISPENLSDEQEQSDLQQTLKQINDHLENLEMKLGSIPNSQKQMERILAEINSIHQQLDWKLEQALNQDISSSHPSKFWKYGLGTLLVIGVINLGGICYLAKRPVPLPQDIMNTYAFGQKMKVVWAKISKAEKEKLAKYLE